MYVYMDFCLKSTRYFIIIIIVTLFTIINSPEIAQHVRYSHVVAVLINVITARV